MLGCVRRVAFHFDYTFYLTVAFLALTVGLWMVRRVGDRRGVAEVTDPVCGLVFERRDAAIRSGGDEPAYFCSPACAQAGEPPNPEPIGHPRSA